jgi:hypothetical protein
MKSQAPFLFVMWPPCEKPRCLTPITLRPWTDMPRVREAACQYRRDCAILSEVGAYSRLKSEQQRAMRELVTGEYWRLVAARNAPHQEPAR